MKNKITAWIIATCLTVTLIPEMAFGVTESNSENKISPEEVTSNDIIEKTESTTTYDLGGGKEMTVLHGGEVRYEDEEGNLIDYNPSLVEIEEGTDTEQNQSLEGYLYTNESGDKKHYFPETISEDTPVRMEYKDYAIDFTLTDESVNELVIADDEAIVEEAQVQTAYEDEAELPVNAVYGGEEDDVKITYTSTEDSVKETGVR